MLLGTPFQVFRSTVHQKFKVLANFIATLPEWYFTLEFDKFWLVFTKCTHTHFPCSLGQQIVHVATFTQALLHEAFTCKFLIRQRECCLVTFKKFANCIYVSFVQFTYIFMFFDFSLVQSSIIVKLTPLHTCLPACASQRFVFSFHFIYSIFQFLGIFFYVCTSQESTCTFPFVYHFATFYPLIYIFLETYTIDSTNVLLH